MPGRAPRVLYEFARPWGRSMPMENLPGGPMPAFVASAVEYMVDAGQRTVLFLDVMRRRGDQYREQAAKTAPHVLQYAAELIIDGRKLDEPVNYALVRAGHRPRPHGGSQADDARRAHPWPRAHHYPGGRTIAPVPGREGFSILLAEQNVRMALAVSHRAYVLRNGEIIDEGSSQSFQRSQAIQRAYLGG